MRLAEILSGISTKDDGIIFTIFTAHERTHRSGYFYSCATKVTYL